MRPHSQSKSKGCGLILVMQEAELRGPQFRRVGDRLGSWYTVFALAIAAAAWVIGRNPERFLAVLVIATPCPLLLAIPVAMIGAISVAASRAIIIKHVAVLERIGSCRTIILDKTGTLTYGEPVLTEVFGKPGIDKRWAMAVAASLEFGVITNAPRQPVSPTTARLLHINRPSTGSFAIEETEDLRMSPRRRESVRQSDPAWASGRPILIEDGWPDIYVADDGPANLLWLNNGNGTFRESALLSGAAYSTDGMARAGMGVAVGDFNGSGNESIFVTNLTGEAATLYQNTGHAQFADSGMKYGLYLPTFPLTGFGAG